MLINTLHKDLIKLINGTFRDVIRIRGGEYILNLILFSLFYLHTGFAASAGWRSNCHRRWRNPTECRTESPGQPGEVNGVSVIILPLLLHSS